MRILFIASSFLTTALLTPLAWAEEQPSRVCVRNFYVTNALETTMPLVQVRSTDDPPREIWTRPYQDTLCQTAPEEFRHVTSITGQKICTVEFHQPGISEYCTSNPRIFAWALAAED
jgi:hypothetical protein